MQMLSYKFIWLCHALQKLEVGRNTPQYLRFSYKWLQCEQYESVYSQIINSKLKRLMIDI